MKDESGWVEVLEVITGCGIALAFIEIIFGLSQNSAQHAIKIIIDHNLTMEWLEKRGV
ncbi:MAG: hypothetical protein ABIU05_15055 [Nitrospirales bacterium]